MVLRILVIASLVLSAFGLGVLGWQLLQPPEVIVAAVAPPPRRPPVPGSSSPRGRCRPARC
ncbi:hypothetical protein ACFQU2_08970 [Siccirubricoccus deserti]